MSIRNTDSKNKGFTLVELIVVLVILAILAAILVPALLGYIDRAKGSQLLLRDNSIMKGWQAQLTKVYATAPEKDSNGDPYTVSSAVDEEHDGTGAAFLAEVAKMADMPSNGGFYYMTADTEAAPSPSAHDAWTLKYFMYYEGDEGAYFDGNSWEEGLTFTQAYEKIEAVSKGSEKHGTLHQYPKND